GLDSLDIDDIASADRRFYQAAVDAVKGADGCIGTPVGGRFFCCFGYPAVKEMTPSAAWGRRCRSPRRCGSTADKILPVSISGSPSIAGSWACQDCRGAKKGFPRCRGMSPTLRFV